MSSNNLCKGKHLRIEDRLIIEYGLDQNYSLKENDLQSCQHRRSCTKTHLCTNSCDKQCKKCRFINCYRSCNEYSIKKCSKLNRYPYVCNSCSTVTTCTGEKNYYKAKVADTKYKELLVASREGINITSSQLKIWMKLFHHLF